MTTKKTPIEPRALERMGDALLDIIEGKTRRVEMNMEFDGRRYLVTAYRLNDQIPVRVDWKLKA